MEDIGTVLTDSLRTAGAGQAFRAGRLVMDHGTAPDLSQAAPAWSDSLINCSLVSACILITAVMLPSILECLPVVFQGLFRTKPLLNVDNNISQARTRHKVALTAFLVISLFTARYGLIRFGFTSGMPDGQETIIVLGSVYAYFLLRRILNSAMMPSGRKKEYFKAADTVWYNFIIILSLVMGAAVTTGMFTGMNDMTVRTMLIFITAGTAALFALRKLEILSEYCNLLIGFLYLCALEIFPAGLLIAASLLF